MILVGVISIFICLLSVFDIEALVRNGGMIIVWLVVYASTGLFFCFFLPVGAVLFVTGVLAATGDLNNNIFTICALLIPAAILGNLTGYWFGWKAGPLLYQRKDSRLFKKRHLRTAETFYNKYGWLALTVGLYLPIIRTFASIVAGMVRLNFRRFILLTVTGSMVWILSFVLAGYFIGSRPFLKPLLKYIVIGFIVLVTIPLIVWIIKELRKMRKDNKEKGL
jgi:membrane-associated protein